MVSLCFSGLLILLCKHHNLFTHRVQLICVRAFLHHGAQSGGRECISVLKEALHGIPVLSHCACFAGPHNT